MSTEPEDHDDTDMTEQEFDEVFRQGIPVQVANWAGTSNTTYWNWNGPVGVPITAEFAARRANGFTVAPRPIPDRWPDGWVTFKPTPTRPDPGLTERAPRPKRWWRR